MNLYSESKFIRLWNSPTLTSWASLLARSLSLLAVLPLVLKNYSAAEVSIYYVLLTIAGLQSLAEFGFTATFIRYFSYGMGGAAGAPSASPRSKRGSDELPPDAAFLGHLSRLVRIVFGRIALAGGIVAGLCGTWYLLPFVEKLQVPDDGWVAWISVLVGTSFSLWGTQFSVLLQGTGRLPLLRRWDALFAFLAIVSSALTLLMGGDLGVLFLVNQFWVILGALRNWGLAQRRAEELKLTSQQDWAIVDRSTTTEVMSAAWRSGVGILFSKGAQYICALAMTRGIPAADAAGLLFAIRLSQIISLFSQAPFYSRLPDLGRLYAKGEIARVVVEARRGMCFSHLSFVVPWVAVGVAGPRLFSIIGASVQFPSLAIWVLLGWGVFTERYGAMHIQLYSLGGNIVWHVANGVTGVLLVGLLYICLRVAPENAYPLAFLGSNILFYTWFCALKSFGFLRGSYIAFECRAAGPALLALGGYTFYIVAGGF